MVKLLRVAVYEYRRQVLRRGFLFALLSVPLMIAVMGVVVLLLVGLESGTRAIGYVDLGRLFQTPTTSTGEDPFGRPVAILPYASESLAREALEERTIDAYYVLADDYLQSGRARLVYFEAPGETAQGEFRDFLRANLLDGQPASIQNRLVEGISLQVESADGRRQVSEGDWFNILLPMISGLAFIIAIFITSGYLMQAVVDEKENRTMEILVTSLSPDQLMAGKVFGLTAVGLTQLAIWFLVAALAALLGRNVFTWMQALRFSPGDLGVLSLIYLPAYLMIAALMAAIGATVTDAREGQQMTGLITLPVMVPFWLTGVIMNQPNSPMAIGLSIFPLTAPVTLSLRMGFAAFPAWQLGLHIFFLFLAAAGALWFASRAFHMGMLRYGQRLRLRELLSRRSG